jgi:hypothetical protein
LGKRRVSSHPTRFQVHPVLILSAIRRGAWSFRSLPRLDGIGAG